MMTVQKIQEASGDGGQEKASQVDFIIGPKDRHDDSCLCNEGKLWDTWDHYPMCESTVPGKIVTSHDFIFPELITVNHIT